MKALAGAAGLGIVLALLGPARASMPGLVENSPLKGTENDGLMVQAREQSRVLARRGSWSPGEVEALVGLQLVDPQRFVADEAFRRRVLAQLPQALDSGAPAGLRDAILRELNQVRGFDFAASEAVERAWGAVPRRASERRVAFSPGDQRFDADIEGWLSASVYSLPSFFFDETVADAFLSGVRAVDPQRTLIVLTDSPLRELLESRARALKIHLWLARLGRLERDPRPLLVPRLRRADRPRPR